MSSGADKNGEPSVVMAAIAELKLELSKQIRESFSSLEARVIALEERSSNVDERIKKLEDQTGYAGILGSFQPQHTTMSIREASSSEAKLEPWNIAVTETVPSVPLPIGSFPKASTVPSFGTTPPFVQQQPLLVLDKFLHVNKEQSVRLVAVIQNWDEPATQLTVQGAQEKHINLSGLPPCLMKLPASLLHPSMEATVFKVSLRFSAKRHQCHSLSSTWGYEGLQPWPPPCSLRTSCLSGKGVMLCTLALAAAQGVHEQDAILAAGWSASYTLTGDGIVYAHRRELRMEAQAQRRETTRRWFSWFTCRLKSLYRS